MSFEQEKLTLFFLFFSMVKATLNDKSLVVDILTQSFDDNNSVNYVVKKDRHRKLRIQRLMEYSFDTCLLFGEIYLSENRKGCVLILNPEKKKTTYKSILLNVKLALGAIGLFGILKVLKRESSIKKRHPNSSMLYLWFVGVLPSEQGKGLGKALLSKLIEKSMKCKKPIYLETSMVNNLDFYQKSGFEIYGEIEEPFRLYLLRRML